MSFGQQKPISKLSNVWQQEFFFTEYKDFSCADVVCKIVHNLESNFKMIN